MTDDSMSTKLSIPESIMQPLLNASNASDLDKVLECLVEIAKSPQGRADLASKNVVTFVLQLCQVPNVSSNGHLLLLSLKVLRNLCAGELINQNSFLKQNGVGTVSSMLSYISLSSETDYKIVQMCLQLLGNFALTGEEHQLAVWHEFFPFNFNKIAQVRRKEICDPLCMVIYACSGETDGLLAELSSTQGLSMVTEIVRTASTVGFSEDWFKVLLSRVCLDKSCFASIFSNLYPTSEVDDREKFTPKTVQFSVEQAFLLNIMSNIVNERIKDVVNFMEFALCVLEILRSSIDVLGSTPRGKSGLPTGHTPIDVLGYSLTILRDVCAGDNLAVFKEEGSADVVDSLVSSGLIELLLNLLRKLEPPSTIKKAMNARESYNEAGGSDPCPYKGFRRDIVSVLGNCAYRRKSVQAEIREKNGILPLLQQCVLDEDNPYLREWGIWTVRNLLEGNAENERVIADLEIQGSVDVPEITGLGVRVELDPETGRPKLVNV